MTALDVARGSLAAARDRAAGAGLAGRIDACAADAAALTFDAVVLSGALTNLEDPGRAVAEAGRVLREGGRLGVADSFVPSRAQATARPSRAPA